MPSRRLGQAQWECAGGRVFPDLRRRLFGERELRPLPFLKRDFLDWFAGLGGGGLVAGLVGGVRVPGFRLRLALFEVSQELFGF